MRPQLSACCALAALFFLLLSGTESKKFTKCGLTQELINNNVSRTWIGNWVCLAENEAYKETTTIKKVDGVDALGLFQIKSKQYCEFEKKGGKCKMLCEDLLNDDISDDVACAKKAIDELGFQAWPGWVRNCKGREEVTKMPECPNLIINP